MMSADQIQLCKDIGYGTALGAFQAYNMWKHSQNKSAIDATSSQSSLGFNDIRDDLASVRAAVERIEVKLLGKDRRAARAIPNSGASQNLARRWGDSPNYNAPATAAESPQT